MERGMCRAPGAGPAPEAGPVERKDAAAGARGQRRHDQAPGERAAAKAVDQHHRALRCRAAALRNGAPTLMLLKTKRQNVTLEYTKSFAGPE